LAAVSELGPTNGLTGGLLGGDLTARLERFAAAARVDEAARGRARERWLRRAASEEATVRGVLVDLAERRAPVAVHTTAGRAHNGEICAVGGDFVALRTRAGTDVLVACDAVVAVRTRPGAPVATGDRPLRLGIDLAQVLDRLAAERERVLLVPRSGADASAVAGVLVAAGHDVLTVRLDGDPPATAYVPAATVGEVALPQ
jgi:hypothetical protein